MGALLSALADTAIGAPVGGHRQLLEAVRRLVVLRTERPLGAPDAPGWFSTTTGWPHLLLRVCRDDARQHVGCRRGLLSSLIILMAWSGIFSVLVGSAKARTVSAMAAIRTNMLGFSRYLSLVAILV